MEENEFPAYEGLTDWKNEPTVRDLEIDFTNAQSFHNEWIGKILHWRNLLNVEGEAKPRKRLGRSSVQPRLIRRQAEWRYSALSEPFLSSEKIFQILPRTYEDTEAARQNEELLNYQFSNVINKTKLIDEIVRSCVNDGTCVVRLGWDRQTKKKKTTVNLWRKKEALNPEELTKLYEQAKELKKKDYKSFEKQIPEQYRVGLDVYERLNTPYEIEKYGEEEKEIDDIIVNRPSLEVLNPENVYFDPTCNGDLDKALFVIISFETNRADLQAAGIYKNLDKVNWDSAPNSLQDGYHVTDSEFSFNFQDKSRKKVIAYEYWGFYDIHDNGELVPIVATWINGVMVRMEENPFPDEKLPFVVMQYLPVVRCIYGEPDAALLEENQRILGAVTRGMIDLLGNSANAQQAFAKGMLDPVNLAKMKRGEDFEFNPNIPLQQGYLQLAYPEIPNSAMNMVNLMNQDAEALTGVKSFAGGLSGDSYGNTNYQVRGVLDAASKREMGILRRIATGVSEIGRKIVAMNYAFLSEHEVVRVTNTEFIDIDREDIKGNFDLIIDINTAEVDNAKVQDLGFMLQTIGPNLDSSINYQILANIAELKKMPSLAQTLREYKPQPNPAQDLEMQKLQSEVALNQAKAQQLGIEAQVAQAKAQFEIQGTEASAFLDNAKAQALMANAQAQNIKTQLEVSGQKHQWDMEKQKAQSAGNRDLEITKSLLKTLKPGEQEPDIGAAIGWGELSDLKNNS